MSLSPKQQQQQQQQQQNSTSFSVHDILDECYYTRKGLVDPTQFLYGRLTPPQYSQPPTPSTMNPMGQMNGPYHGYVHPQLTSHHHHHPTAAAAAASFATQYCPGTELSHYNAADPMQGVRNTTTSPWYAAAAAGSDPRLASKYAHEFIYSQLHACTTFSLTLYACMHDARTSVCVCVFARARVCRCV